MLDIDDLCISFIVDDLAYCDLASPFYICWFMLPTRLSYSGVCECE